MTSNLDISTTVTNEERQHESDFFQLFQSQATNSDYIDAYYERIIPREAITDSTRTLTCISEASLT